MTKELSEFANAIAYAQADGLGIQRLSRLLMEKLKKTVIITDIYGNVLSWHSPMHQDVRIEERLTLPSTVSHFEDIPKKAMTVIGEEKYDVLIWPINRERIMGYLLVLNHEIQAMDTNYVEITCRAIMIELVRKQERYESIQKYKDDFIRDILFNNYDGFDTAIRAGKMWGWDFSLPYIAIIMELNTKDFEIDKIRPLFEKQLLSLRPNCIIGKVGSSLVILYPVTENKQNNWKSDIRELYNRLLEQLKDISFSMGIGKYYRDTNMLYRSYQQAKIALELGELSKLKGAAFFEELGAVRLFYNQGEQELEEFIDEILGPIIKYGEEKENSLLLTLWEYFRADTNITVATQNLYIHGNTLRYRLKKIEELLGKSLDDIETKFNIYAALKAAAMLGKV
jgi:sugar diacid utilization regulator